jgi:hypothetical protein
VLEERDDEVVHNVAPLAASMNAASRSRSPSPGSGTPIVPPLASASGGAEDSRVFDRERPVDDDDGLWGSPRRNLLNR